jgi:hypothetical protein
MAQLQVSIANSTLLRFLRKSESYQVRRRLIGWLLIIDLFISVNRVYNVFLREKDRISFRIRAELEKSVIYKSNSLSMVDRELFREGKNVISFSKPWDFETYTDTRSRRGGHR